MDTQTNNIIHIRRIFDRHRNGHPWRLIFQQMDSHAEISHQVICSNWRMDHRVSEPREQAMLNSVEYSSVSSVEDWWQQKNKYFGEAVCQPATVSAAGRRSVYVHACNVTNAISPKTIPIHDQLVHVASLNSILWRLSSADNAMSADFKIGFYEITGMDLPERRGRGGMDNIVFEANVNDVANRIIGKGPEEIKKLAGFLVDGLGDTQPPWWGCFAQEVMPLINKKDWPGLCHALGLGHLNGNHWLLFWRYPVGYAGDLYRPTVIEANDSYYHYPSPPDKPYGITMPLSLSAVRAYREVIHPPLREQSAIDFCTGELGRIAGQEELEYDEVLALREKHRRRLARESRSNEGQSWLQRHGDLP